MSQMESWRCTFEVAHGKPTNHMIFVLNMMKKTKPSEKYRLKDIHLFDWFVFSITYQNNDKQKENQIKLSIE